MKQLTIKNGNLYLDNEKVENLKMYKVVSYTDMETAELTLVIDVKTNQTVTESTLL